MIFSIVLSFLFILQIILLFGVLFSFLSQIISIAFGAPYVPIPKKNIRKILSFGGLSSDDVFCDLGCGDGRILSSSIFDFNVSRAIGCELAPWPYFKTLFLIKHNRLKKIELFRKNCLKADISQTTFIYLYLFPNLVDKIAYKIAKEGTPKTKILCVAFPIDTNKHTEFCLLKSEKINDSMLYLYELKSP